MRVDYAVIVSGFLDQAEGAGSATSPTSALTAWSRLLLSSRYAAVDLDLLSRSAVDPLDHPARVVHAELQRDLPDAHERHDRRAERRRDKAFVHADDIASVAAATLVDPATHAGASYAPTGPEALTVTQTAEIISTAVARTITYSAIDQDAWIDAMVAAGVALDYTKMLRLLTSTVASGNGSRPNDDVLTVTGRSPISFADFAVEAVPAWK